MNEKGIIPVQLKWVKDPDGKSALKATVPMNWIFKQSFDARDLEEELAKIERRYLYLVTCLKCLWAGLHANMLKNRRVLLYWEMGDKIVDFVEQNENTPFCTENLTRSLIRDVGISGRTLIRCKRFRLLYPDVTKIDPSKSFDSYIAIFEKGHISDKRRNKK